MITLYELKRALCDKIEEQNKTFSYRVCKDIIPSSVDIQPSLMKDTLDLEYVNIVAMTNVLHHSITYKFYIDLDEIIFKYMTLEYSDRARINLNHHDKAGVIDELYRYFYCAYGHLYDKQPEDYVINNK